MSDKRMWFSDGPLSNEYACRFAVHGVMYDSINEFMAKQALLLRDPPAMGSLTPDFPKGSNVNWDLRLFDLCKYAIYEKVMQNVDIKKLLVESGTRSIAYANMAEETTCIVLRRDSPERTAIPGTFNGAACLAGMLSDVRTRIINELSNEFPDDEECQRESERLQKRRVDKALEKEKVITQEVTASAIDNNADV